MNRDRAIGFAGLILLALSTLAMLVMHRERPDLDPLRTPISFYGRGTGGWLLSVSLITSGLGVDAIAWRVARRLGRPMGPSLVGVGGLALIVAALVPSDLWFPWEHAMTPAGWVHAGAAALAVFAFPLGALITTRDERKSTRAGPLNRLLDVLTVCFLLLFAVFGAITLVFIVAGRTVTFLGLAERVMMTFAVAWLAVASREPRASATSLSEA